jgi:hypothetical protein
MTSSKALNLRIEDAARESLDALAKRKPYSIVSRHKLALIALDLGLAALAENPQLLLLASPGAPTPWLKVPDPQRTLPDPTPVLDPMKRDGLQSKP